MIATIPIRLEEELLEAIKKSYIENKDDFEFESISDVVAYLLKRDAILVEMEKDPEIVTRVEDVERDHRIAELEEELGSLKREASQSAANKPQAKVAAVA